MTGRTDLGAPPLTLQELDALAAGGPPEPLERARAIVRCEAELLRRQLRDADVAPGSSDAHPRPRAGESGGTPTRRRS